MAEDQWEREERYGNDSEKTEVKQPAPWNETVVIRSARADNDVLVGSASQAASLLQDNWPGPKTSPAYQAAVTACQQAMNGHAPGYIAR
ncbi:DUF982 domain-containing protein [Ensifer sp. 1H6]|uniref:DUF982 domain-containing protein n=1 Tax=Ensifer sp. 1H6 TaxID=1911585 RepID=UPI0009C82F73|nr:DUF982 domain-containing protein [Ensifer sp. 1H6]OMQ39876.1 hypothetical protein BKP54_30710 [Ensifer sp. 1H6]